jgi:hypothetical protein
MPYHVRNDCVHYNADMRANAPPGWGSGQRCGAAAAPGDQLADLMLALCTVTVSPPDRQGEPL